MMVIPYHPAAKAAVAVLTLAATSADAAASTRAVTFTVAIELVFESAASEAAWRHGRRMAADRRAFNPGSHVRVLEEVAAALTAVNNDA